LHLLVVPVAGVDQHRLGPLGDAGGLQLAVGGVEHGSTWPKSAAETLTSAAMTICRSLATAWAL
jgi:hypothetical protein